MIVRRQVVTREWAKFVRPVADTWAISDNAHTVSWAASATDAVGVADLAQRVAVLGESSSDSLSVSDGVTREGHGVEVAESIALSEVLTSWPPRASDTFSLGDAA